MKKAKVPKRKAPSKAPVKRRRGTLESTERDDTEQVTKDALKPKSSVRNELSASDVSSPRPQTSMESWPGASTQESLERVKQKHKNEHMIPVDLDSDDFELLLEDLNRRRQRARENRRRRLDEQLRLIELQRYKPTEERAHGLDRPMAKDERDAALKLASMSRRNVERLLRMDDKQFLSVLQDAQQVAVSRRLRRRGKKQVLTSSSSDDWDVKNAQRRVVAQQQAQEQQDALKKLGVPPNVYFDNKLSRTEFTSPIDTKKTVMAAGPFGVGEAKACLDDLYSHLLSHYSKIFRISPDVPLDVQIDRLQEDLSLSPYPLCGPDPLDVTIKRLEDPLAGPAEGAKLVARRETEVGDIADRRDDAKARLSYHTQKVPTADNRAPTRKEEGKRDGDGDGAKGGDGDANVEKVEATAGYIETEPKEFMRPPATGLADMINELYDKAVADSERLIAIQREVDRELTDPASRVNVVGSFQRSRRPKYWASRFGDWHASELEEHVETLYRNLRIQNDWLQRKQKLLENRLVLLKKAADEDDINKFVNGN